LDAQGSRAQNRSFGFKIGQLGQNRSLIEIGPFMEIPWNGEAARREKLVIPRAFKSPFRAFLDQGVSRFGSVTSPRDLLTFHPYLPLRDFPHAKPKLFIHLAFVSNLDSFILAVSSHIHHIHHGIIDVQRSTLTFTPNRQPPQSSDGYDSLISVSTSSGNICVPAI